MTNDSTSIHLSINSTRIARIIDAAVVSSNEIVDFHFNALDEADLTQAPGLSAGMYKFNPPQLNGDQRRQLHENWILAKAFHELLRAVRHALEEAHVINALLTKTHKISSSNTLADFLKPFKRKAEGLRFPELLEAVNKNLQPKLIFADSYKSLQMARNCLEHRFGLISEIETKGEEHFKLSVPRLKTFYERDGDEIELVPGHRVEPGDDRAEVKIFLKLEVRERTLKLGERVKFSLDEFKEIAFSCHFLGQQISAKLPQPKITQASSEDQSTR